VLLFLADLYKHRNDVDDHQIFEWLSGALKIADEIKAQDLLSKAYYNLHEYYQQKGNFKESLVQLEAHFQLEKELHKNSINQKVANLEISHKAEVVSQRNKELTELNEQIEKANEELKIERSLERVRTAAMAMKEPSDMLEVCKIISDQLEILNVKKIRNVQTAIFYEEKNAYMNYEYYAKHDKLLITEVDYNNHPVAKKFADQMLKGPNEVFAHGFTGKEVKEWLDYQKTTNVFIDTYLETADSLNYYWYSLGPVALGISTYVPLNENEIDLFKRFRNVFELAYRRYRDIEKAEAQAKEAQIEAALERVRSRTMGMQRSDELPEAANLLFQQIQSLGIHAFSTGYNIWEENKKTVTSWMSSEGIIQPSFKLPLTEETSLVECYEAALRGDKLFVQELKGAKLVSHFTYMQTLPVVGELMMKIAEAGFPLPDFIINHHVFFSHGYLLFITYEPVPEAHEIFKRFSTVFEQTYTRFLDLQKAEAQTRESQIELGLERVRARAMAMQKSDELKDLISTVSGELGKLDIVLDRCFIVTYDLKTMGSTWWMSHPESPLEPLGLFVKYHEQPPYLAHLEAWRQRLIKWQYILGGEIKRKWDEFLFVETELSQLPDFVIASMRGNDEVYLSSSFNNFGYLTLATLEPLSDEQFDILLRFAKVFDLTYTRFNDLKQAEAQARAARIEAALERVRARALAMQEPDELKDVAQVLRTEMGLLGVEELETCSIYINDESAEKAECWYALKDIRSEEKKLVNDHFALNLNDTWVGREMLKFYGSSNKQASIVMQGDNRKEWISYCEENSAPLRGYYGEVIPDRTYHLYKFSHGAIGAAAAGEISEESWHMLNRAASVFSLAYSRFKDLTQALNDLIRLKEEKKRAEDALTELQATQKQLIQSEKMASLGELTAGIAHEIQNPLNFVNNFSDVSNELLEEMKTELEKGNAAEAKAIAIDVKENLEKILHHGKRADAIVKGMLQHSRSSGGQKEPTDINTLAEEYLRLAYHGLRAKDKFFNAKFETDLDPSISKINIVPQEIGRVILNLINNSFYAVSEKKKAFPSPEGGIRSSQDLYEPTVKVKTSLNPPSGGRGAEVVISVIDNGIGIPKKALDKIFQPFFTTKPTGQGTGLGLSLSYDIVTQGHDGEIKVETKEGEGSAFTISLPMK